MTLDGPVTSISASDRRPSGRSLPRGNRCKLDGMPHRSYRPSSPLSDFIGDFWFYADYTPPHLEERILPSGTVELVLNLRDNEVRIYDRMRTRSVRALRRSDRLTAPTNRFFMVDTAEEASVVGVHFQAGRRVPLLRPAGERARQDARRPRDPVGTGGPSASRAAPGYDHADGYVSCRGSDAPRTAVGPLEIPRRRPLRPRRAQPLRLRDQACRREDRVQASHLPESQWRRNSHLYSHLCLLTRRGRAV